MENVVFLVRELLHYIVANMRSLACSVLTVCNLQNNIRIKIAINNLVVF